MRLLGRKGREICQRKKKRILIVEDEKKISQVIRVNLMMAGYLCEVASDGEEGLQMALSGDFDLILLDLMLPKRDGFSVCRENPADPFYADHHGDGEGGGRGQGHGT